MMSQDVSSKTSPYQLFFKTLTGKTWTAWFSPHMEGYELYNWAAEKMDIPINLVRIISCGRTLARNKKLLDQNVEHEATLHLLMRCPTNMEEQIQEHRVGQQTDVAAVAAAVAIAVLQDLAPVTAAEKTHEQIVGLLGLIEDGKKWRAMMLRLERRRSQPTACLVAGGGVLRRAGGGCCPTCRQQCDCCPTCQRSW